MYAPKNTPEIQEATQERDVEVWEAISRWQESGEIIRGIGYTIYPNIKYIETLCWKECHMDESYTQAHAEEVREEGTR